MFHNSQASLLYDKVKYISKLTYCDETKKHALYCNSQTELKKTPIWAMGGLAKDNIRHWSTESFRVRVVIEAEAWSTVMSLKRKS